MNWNSPVADELLALRLGLKFDSTLAVASRYSKLAPVACAARWIAPATPDAGGLTPCCGAGCRTAGVGFGRTDMTRYLDAQSAPVAPATSPAKC